MNTRAAFVNLNGRLVTYPGASEAWTNRGFLYGDGLFESIRMFDGKLPFLLHHFRRLNKGCALLNLESPLAEHVDHLEAELLKTCSGLRNARLRLTLYRSGPSGYRPTTTQAAFVIHATELEHNRFELNQPGWKVGICPIPYLPTGPLAGIKSCNALPYVLASRYGDKQGWDEVLLLNNYGRIAEASAFNLILIHDHQLVTPPCAAEGAVEGTMLGIALQIARELGYHTVTKPVDTTDLLSASSIMLTNAIQGIRWVKEFSGKSFDCGPIPIFVGHLNKLVT